MSYAEKRRPRLTSCRAPRWRTEFWRGAWAMTLLLVGGASGPLGGCALGGRAGLRWDLTGSHDSPGFYGGPTIAAPVVPPVGSTVVVPGFSALFTGGEPMWLLDTTLGYGQARGAAGGAPWTWGAGANVGLAFGGPRVQVVGGVCGLAGQGLATPSDGGPASVSYLLGSLCARLSSQGWLGVDVAPYYHIPLTFYR